MMIVSPSLQGQFEGIMFLFACSAPCSFGFRFLYSLYMCSVFYILEFLLFVLATIETVSASFPRYYFLNNQ